MWAVRDAVGVPRLWGQAVVPGRFFGACGGLGCAVSVWSSVAPQAVTTDPVRLLWAGLGGSDGFYAIRLTQHDGRRVTAWPGVGRRGWVESICGDFGWRGDIEWSARAYLDRGSRRLMGDTGASWVRAETGHQVAALEAFDPEPSLVLREGGTVRHVAFWFHPRPLGPDAGERLNRHLAHRLRCAKKWAAQLDFAPPGSVIREGRARPLPVVVAGGSSDLVTVRELCRTLPRAIPDPDAWRARANG